MSLAGAGCTALLDMAAPQLGDDGSDASLEASSIDVGAGETSTPGSPDTGLDASSDAARETAVDVAIDTTVVDAPAEAAIDAALDQLADGPMNGVVCGYGSSCGQSSRPYCCETTDPAGAPAFACVSSESACSGYFVECANENDCSNSGICCQYDTGMRCETPTQGGSCPNGATTQACDPANSGECPARETCSQHLTINGMPSPYLGCQ